MILTWCGSVSAAGSVSRLRVGVCESRGVWDGLASRDRASIAARGGRGRVSGPGADGRAVRDPRASWSRSPTPAPRPGSPGPRPLPVSPGDAARALSLSGLSFPRPLEGGLASVEAGLGGRAKGPGECAEAARRRDPRVPGKKVRSAPEPPRSR